MLLFASIPDDNLFNQNMGFYFSIRLILEVDLEVALMAEGDCGVQGHWACPQGALVVS